VTVAKRPEGAKTKAMSVFAALAVLAAGCWRDTDNCSTLPHPGQVLTAQPLVSAAALPSASSNRLITYVSEDPHGQPIVVSGTVAVPKSQPPKNGWPVISWAHGTTGYADICAPSLDFDDGPAHDYLGPVASILDTWVARGYAVVQTDYQGLGSPGDQPYANGVSEAHDVADIVQAAHKLDSSIGTDWVAVGHSQGGQAALFAAADTQPETDLKGAVAIAPGSGFGHTVEFVTSDAPGAEAAQPFIALLVLGAAAADPAINPDDIFTPQFKQFVATTRTRCLSQVRELAPAGTVFTPGADLKKLTDYLAGQEPANLTPRVPFMIAQGLTDTTLPPVLADTLAKAYCDKGLAVTYRTYPEADHRESVAASLTDTQGFVGDVLSRRPPPDSCTSL
jgi:pimeloyl-ACP methyl ester carboxylesterase